MSDQRATVWTNWHEGQRVTLYCPYCGQVTPIDDRNMMQSIQPLTKCEHYSAAAAGYFSLRVDFVVKVKPC